MEPLVHEAAFEFSLFELFLSADWVVKSVMIGLVGASVWCWAVTFNRIATFARTRREMRAFDKAFAATQSMEELHTRFAKHQLGNAPVFNAAMDEWTQSSFEDANDAEGLRGRLQIALDLAVTEQSEALESRLGILATVSSSAPFIGLFGTVWGIMNAFTAIAASKDTSLAVVAPGIAEALFATALGLLAAIPAVIAYNKLSGDAAGLISRIETFADKLLALMSRNLDAGKNRS